MRRLEPREKAILVFLGALVVALGFYYYIYTPKMKQINLLSQQLKTQQTELARLQAEAAHKDELERQVAALQKDVQTSEAKLPSAREIPVLLVQLEGLASQVGADLTLIKPGPLQAPQQTPGQPPKPGAPAAAAAGGPSYQTFSLELTADGTFDQIQSFLHGIETFPRFISMTDIRMSPNGQAGTNPPKLTLALQATTYVVPESGAGR